MYHEHATAVAYAPEQKDCSCNAVGSRRHLESFLMIDEATVRRWLPYVARLEDMGGCSWGSAALSWLYRCMCHMASRHGVKLARPLQLLQS
ncbi:hypothetical protein Ahy_A10g047901 [Arachis hypogaea]|uniref:Aminotransferase-like plant mobile domain-containing protein n=1 Tax=Arachis hypogaea TaxID=3818 RepID=A0A445B3X3_ARAHY|nr:hypothetical protein Ahy_A10g047901 [Arachis hypogaea]